MRVLVYIEENLDKALELKDLAKVAQISTFHFHRIFLAIMGETVQSYIKQLRLKAAAGLLRYSERPIIEIGQEVGYESHAAFTKMFNRMIGLLPSLYRERMRPLVAHIIQRTQTKRESVKVEYIVRKKEEVLFVRRVGDYQKTPEDAFKTLIAFLESEHKMNQIKAFYGVGLDDPSITDLGKLRFDACVSLKEHVSAKGEVGKRVFLAGPYARFIHKGAYAQLEKSFLDIFQCWYPNSDKEVADGQPIFEYPELLDDTIPENERITYIYLPLKW